MKLIHPSTFDRLSLSNNFLCCFVGSVFNENHDWYSSCESRNNKTFLKVNFCAIFWFREGSLALLLLNIINLFERLKILRHKKNFHPWRIEGNLSKFVNRWHKTLSWVLNFIKTCILNYNFVAIKIVFKYRLTRYTVTWVSTKELPPFMQCLQGRNFFFMTCRLLCKSSWRINSI